MARQKYSPEFKERLVRLTESRPVKEVAAEFGVPKATLYEWVWNQAGGARRRQLRRLAAEQEPGPDQDDLADCRLELARQENERLKAAIRGMQGFADSQEKLRRAAGEGKAEVIRFARPYAS